MSYRLHDGIVFTNVCNIPLLVATRSAWDAFEAVKKVSPVHSYFLRGILAGKDKEYLLEHINIPIRKDKLEKSFDTFLSQMIGKGYLIEEGDDEKQGNGIHPEMP